MRKYGIPKTLEGSQAYDCKVVTPRLAESIFNHSRALGLLAYNEGNQARLYEVISDRMAPRINPQAQVVAVILEDWKKAERVIIVELHDGQVHIGRINRGDIWTTDQTIFLEVDNSKYETVEIDLADVRKIAAVRYILNSPVF